MKKRYLWGILVLLFCLVGGSLVFLPKSFAKTEAYCPFKLSLKNNRAGVGDKLYLNLETNVDLLNMKVTMKSTTSDEKFTSYVVNQDTNPYIIIPNTVPVNDTYQISFVTLVHRDEGKEVVEYFTTDTTQLTGNNLYLEPTGNQTVLLVPTTKVTLQTWEFPTGTLVTPSGKTVELSLAYETNLDIGKVKVAFKHQAGTQSFSSEVVQTNGKYYITIPEGIQIGNYDFLSISFYPKGSTTPSYTFINPRETHPTMAVEDTDFFTTYSILTVLPKENFTTQEEVPNNSTTIVDKTSLLKNVSLRTSVAQKNQKVYVNLSTEERLESALFFFYNKNGESVPVYLKSVNKEPYFIVPYTMREDSYELEYVILKTTSGKEEHYQKNTTTENVKQYAFNSSLQVKGIDNSAKDIMLENDTLTEELISEIQNSHEKAVITLNATNDPIVKSSIFKVLQNTSKSLIVNYQKNQWIFSGKDIIRPKDIDVSMNILNILPDKLTGIIDSGYMIDYKDNGNLPGKMLARIYATEELRNYFAAGEVYAYYYNEASEKLQEVSSHVVLSDDGYYEFYISHNSKYILTATKIDKAHLLDDDSMLLLNTPSTDSNQTTLYMIIGVLIVCIIIMGILIVVKKERPSL